MLVSTLGARAATVQHAAARPVYGGTLRIAYTSDMVTFDPAQSISDDWFLVSNALYNGLYKFDRIGRPQLDLAAMPPTISADRTVWTFQIRKGVLFSNGMEVTANDVKYSITRTLDPHLKPAVSWGQTTDEIFQGWQDFVNGRARSISGIQVRGRYTIRFVLTHPVAIFPDILAESYNFVVPKAVVTRESPEYFASHPVGTGPFVLKSWQKGVKLVFVRNPHYFRPGKPYLDQIIVAVNVPATVITLKIEKGEIDGFGWDTEENAADLQQVRSDPRYARYLVTAPVTFVVYVDLDVHVDPLTKLALRQAIAMALNRGRLVKLLGGMAIPATQIYVPLDPQYDPALDLHPIYPYDPQKAAALVRASGYHGQPISVLYPYDKAYDVSLAPGIQQDLHRIGLNVVLRGASWPATHAIRTRLTGHQINFAAWLIDFPDAYDTYASVMDCGANAAGGTAGAHYCDPTADHLVAEAQSLPLGAARDTLLRQAQMRILRSAAKVPLVFLKSVEMVSTRVGGFYYQPMLGWQFENYWLQG
jgi:ABC-type transport system substrate-binding protein